MNIRISYRKIIGTAVLLCVGFLTTTADAKTLSRVTNVSPNPAGTNEFWLTATNVITSINGTNVHVNVYMDDPPGGGGSPVGLPSPLIESGVGMMIICHFQNKLTNNIEGASIHWHGIELDNDSDGTAVSQDSIMPGQTYTYRFVPPRAGLFWYHSHMLPGNTTFGGMYGPIIITNSVEGTLRASGILPSTNYTFPLVMGDISFTNGVVGKVVNGTNYSLNTLIQFCENYALGLSAAGQPFCGSAGPPGDVMLINGTVPAMVGGFCAPTSNSAPVFYIGKNQRVRLQLFCESISRDYYLTLHYPCSNPTGDTNLYHIGGQGGLLDNAVLDGGVQSGYDFLYKKGTIMLGTGMRSDVMFYSSGNGGDVIQLVGNPPVGPWNLSAAPTNYPVAFFVVTNGGVADTPLAAGSPILAGTGFENENLKLLNTNSLIPPPLSTLGSVSGVMTLQNGLVSNAATNVYTPAGSPNMGGYAATALDGNTGFGSWLNVPHPPTAIWARIGDVLQLAIANKTGAAGGSAMHPYHLHGFSMQPVSIYSSDLVTNLFNFPFNEFVDTYEVYPGQALVFRIKLTDRPVYADSATGGPVTVASDAPTGGGVGRWLMHCHIFLHATIGMISELVVVSNSVIRTEGPASGIDSVVLAGTAGTPWTASTNAPWLHLSTPNRSGTGSTNVVFSYDANAGNTRVGALNVAGETVNVTQAGITYVAAPAPVTTLTNGFSQAANVAVDKAGNVYISDRGHNSIREWTAATTALTSIVSSGISSPEGIATDNLGNVYFADGGNNAIKRWSATSHTVTTLTTSGISNPQGLAVDGAGNVYIAMAATGVIKEWLAANNTVITLVSSGLTGPYGVAVDAAGNVFIANTDGNSIKRWDAVTHAVTDVITNGLSTPWNLAVDDAGNLYIADGGNDAIKKWIAANSNVVTLATGLGDPTDVAVDALQNVYIADFGNNAVDELPRAFVDPTPQNESAAGGGDVLPVVLPVTENLYYPFFPTTNQPWLDVTGELGGIVNFFVSPNPGASRSGDITVLGEDIPVTQQGASFALGTGNLLQGPAAGSNSVVLAATPSIAPWTASSQASWLHLSVGNQSGIGSTNIIFTYDANAGGTRSGTLTIAGKILTVLQAGSTYVAAPQPLTTLATIGLNEPESVAVDASGNVIISDAGNNAIKLWTRGNNSLSTLINNGLSTPQGVVVDGAGNIYLADFFNYAIKEIPAGTTNVVTLVSNLASAPTGIALDSATNIYWASPGDNTIKEWTAASGNVSLVIRLLDGPYGVAIDAANNLYVANTTGNTIEKWTAANGNLTFLVTNGLNSPWNLAVDNSGNVYIADGNNNDIKEWTAVNSNLVTLTLGVSSPTGVAVDASHNVYIADFDDNAVKEVVHAFVDPTPQTVSSFAGSGVLPIVLFSSENLLSPFAPTSDQSWLSITNVAGGVVGFSFTANPTFVTRTAHVTLLGQSIAVTQAAGVSPINIINAKLLTNGVFQFGFTNANTSASFSVLFSTNVGLPLTNWAVIGTASNISPGLLQFTDLNATNQTRFYMIRSP